MDQRVALFSKRNEVYRIRTGQGPVILKVFVSQKDKEREEKLLRLLGGEGLLVPKVLKAEARQLTLEDLGDQTLLSWMEEAESSGITPAEPVFDALLSCLKGFYRLTKETFGCDMILYDMNFRNFLMKEGRIYRVDFEEVRRGPIVGDLARLLAFSTSYDPPNTPFKEHFRQCLFEGMLRTFSIDEDLLLEEEARAHEEIRKRRKR